MGEPEILTSSRMSLNLLEPDQSLQQAPAFDAMTTEELSGAMVDAAIVPTLSQPEFSSSDLFSQTTSTEDLPVESGEPPPGTQTPSQDTPDTIEFDVTPGPTIDTPDDAPETSPPTSPTEGSTPAPETTQQEPRVLVAEVVVSGAEGDLQTTVYDAIQTQPGRTTTRSQLQEDINAVFATGYFANVRVLPEDTPLGVRITFQVEPNPILRQVQLSDTALETVQVDGNEVPIQQAVDDIFAEQYGQILNFRDLQAGIQELNQLYQDNGLVLAQVVDSPRVTPDGVVTLNVAEGVIEDIEVVFLNEEGSATDEDGNPIDGKTRDFIITREFESAPGEVFNQNRIQADLQRVYDLGLFEDVRVSLNPGSDPRKVDVIVNVIERNTGSIAAGVGFSSSSGLFGTVSYQERNLGGNNQSLGAEVQVGQRDLLFDVSFTDPWIATDPYRTSYTVNAFSRRSISLIFDGGDREIELPNGDRPRVQRLGGGISFSRPLDEWLGWDNWRASVGLQYQNVSIRDADGALSPIDEFGNDLSFSGSGTDDLFLIQLSAARDLRNSFVSPTSGSVLRLSTEQTVPIGNGSITFTRLRASYSHYIPVRFTDFTPGCRLDNPSPSDCPQTLAFNVQVGTVLGDLPPYEAFSLGGTDSVRGYDSGELGSGRSFVQATVEYRFPIFAIIGGALFVDFGTDLGTADNVPGSPAEIRDKPGTGFGYGLGVRVQSPVGQIRVDYGINDEGEGRIHFGIGERF
jgi:outer membrane protein insertion porin family